ncbi:thioesterase family protein [Frigidibacter sp. MR17.14]|uniref:acyl-CoA thioesterase n=1 Tax=Frigidibacter sp. MR17.14 TaxID=3126509 RepID=UPI0030130F90
MTAPLVLGTLVVHPWHCDRFGHMNTRHYAAAFDDAIFVFWSRLPGDGAIHPVTAAMKTGFLAEAPVGTVAEIHARIGRIGGKSVTLELSLVSTTGVLATCEVAEVFFDATTRTSAPIPDPVRNALTASAA